ncbi:hypothetical protein QWJ26_08365 [Streptomyces sp. CSDS2]|uniref:hypothetical protein n=1 Tax=Streptomyces sp. CSDS2 TaxID=3055051 RepID=UPI0025B132C9|nr:hypothetical protein [Streptomyces sp. CSDS2]MDN3259825.1 hypothetical protein [Streptomyces sp. CSDS2]
MRSAREDVHEPARGDTAASPPPAPGFEETPKDTAAGRVEALEQMVLEAETAIVRLRQSLATMPWPALALDGREGLTGEELQAFLAQVTDHVTGPVLEMRPGAGMRPRPLRQVPVIEFGRDIGVHVLCQHVTRFGADLREELQLLEEQGALVRTMETLPDWFLVLGDALALVCGRADEDEGDGVSDDVFVVRDPAVVRVLRAVFTDYWLRARPFSQGGWRGPQIEVVSHEVNALIIRMLCTGAKDELVARRLGMSVRTLRRRIADMLTGLDAASRFQAGFEIGRSLGDEAICDAELRVKEELDSSV